MSSYVPEVDASGPVDPLAWEGKAHLCKRFEDLYSFCNCLIMCGFLSANQAGAGAKSPLRTILKLLSAVTGMTLDAEQMLRIGERGIAIRKLLATACGYSRRDDGLHVRFSEPLHGGPCEGAAVDDAKLQAALDEYYGFRRYDDRGPTPEMLKDLGMGDVIQLRVEESDGN